MEQKKPNVFLEVWYANWKFSHFKDFMQRKKGRIFLHMLIIVMFSFLLKTLIPYCMFEAELGGIKSMIQKMPDFELEHGELWVENPFLWDDGRTYVEIDTGANFTNDTQEIAQIMQGYSQVILMDSNKMIMKDNGTFKSYYFSDFGDALTFNKASLVNLIPMYYFIVFIAMVFIVAFKFIGYFLSALVVAAIGALILAGLHMKLPFGKIYIMSIYARTLPLLLGAIFSILGLNIPFFWWLGVIASSIYVFLALRNMKKTMQPVAINQPYYSGQPYGVNYPNQGMMNQANQGMGMNYPNQGMMNPANQGMGMNHPNQGMMNSVNQGMGMNHPNQSMMNQANQGMGMNYPNQGMMNQTDQGMENQKDQTLENNSNSIHRD